MPRVSIVAPTYNHAKYIERAVKSVLAQTFGDFELIISDDASTDNTLDVLSQFNDPRIKILKNQINVGITGNSWRCWQHCTGELFTCIPTDDEWEPHNLERVVAEFDKDREMIGLFGMATFIDERGTPTGESWSTYGVGLNSAQLLRSIWDQQPAFCAPAGTFKSEVLRKTGYFPKHLKQINDLAAYLPIFAAGEVKVIQDKLVRFRLRDGEANSSAPSQTALTRFAFEMYHVLFDFAKVISDFDMLFRVFPEARTIADPAKVPFKEYFLARLALQYPHASYRMFALSSLYELLADDQRAEILQKECGFTYPQLFELEGEQPVLAEPYLLGQYDHFKRLSQEQANTIARLKEEIASVRSDLTSLDEHCRLLTARENEMKSSTSWKITAPLRGFRGMMGASSDR